ncbi:MAG: carboxymuconolactone decarboxylase family protein [Gammaproteobacteria bacterium]|nr:MAG: carboxymuconolactone decarboxylase family protein [Gammaproteobacteria bacterium]
MTQVTGRARELLEQARERLGFVPNMYALMAHCPPLLEEYLEGYARFREQSGFSPEEQEVAFLSISVENRCHYCVAAHSTLADSIPGLPAAVIDAIREGRPVPDQRLGALSEFGRELVRSRGAPSPEALQRFLAAGYGQEQVLALLLAVGVKTLSNYANHLFGTPLDAIFEQRAWRKDARG